jgi:hypothetical protein
MANKNFQFSFTTSQNANEVYNQLLDVRSWWSGLYNEIISGNSLKLDDEFSFSAGGGAHFSKQKLIALVPDKTIKWLVIESNLSFLTKTDEWNNTKICFDIEQVEDKTKVTFTHEVLVPQIECYGGCSSAWTKYLENLEKQIEYNLKRLQLK